MRVAVFGNKTSTKELIVYLAEKNMPIKALITFKAGKSEENAISGYSLSLRNIAQEKGIELIEVDDYSLKSEELQKKIIDQKFDLGLVTGWQRLIPLNILKSFSFGVFGWHGSFLKFPNGRGRSPLNWSLRLGEKVIYHNFFQYDEGADTGGLYETYKFAIEPSDYISDVQGKALSHMKTSALKLIQNYLCDKPMKLLQQPKGVAIEFPKINPTDGLLQPTCHTVDQALNIIRSSSRPFPGAFLGEKGCKKIIVWRASKDADSHSKTKRIDFIDGPLFLTDYE